jgi:peroxiredoxin
MKAYQADIAKLEDADSVVFGISVDSPFANDRFAKENDIKFQLLSDMTRRTMKDYGVLNEESQLARRTTFVVDKQGVIQHIETGASAVDPTGAITMCSTLKKKETQ